MTASRRYIMQFIKGESAILGAAKKLAGEETSYRKGLHICLCSALNHAQEHGDTGIVTKVFDLIGPSTHRKGVDIWMRNFTNLRYRKNKEGVYMYLKPQKEPVKVALDEAVETPFWDTKGAMTDNAPPLWDFEKRLVGLISNTEARIQEKPETVAHIQETQQHLKVAKEFAAKLGLSVEAPEAQKAEVKVEKKASRTAKASTRKSKRGTPTQEDAEQHESRQEPVERAA
jgi:hypothetical protein